mgnify:CR=1 FL=1
MINTPAQEEEKNGGSSLADETHGKIKSETLEENKSFNKRF